MTRLGRTQRAVLRRLLALESRAWVNSGTTQFMVWQIATDALLGEDGTVRNSLVRLEARGLVSRLSGPGLAATLWGLTDKGRELAREAA